MKPEERRSAILSVLQNSEDAVSGARLAAQFQVSRQVIVQDISILRAAGEKIVATPQGYTRISSSPVNTLKKTMAVCHHPEQLQEELEIIVDAGGSIIDVIVEHGIYGEIQGLLLIRSRRDISLFLEQLQQSQSKPLSLLTHGVHLHTIEAPDQETLAFIEQALDQAGLLVK